MKDPAVALRTAAAPTLRAWMATHGGAVQSLLYRTIRVCEEPLRSYVYDSEGRRYGVQYVVVAAGLDGRVGVVPSHSPKDFSWTPGYPEGFQTRDLGTIEESQKIRTIARNLEPYRLLGRHMDATLGPPVVWPGPDGRLYVLGGNGRTLAFLRADDAHYAAYVKEGRTRWAECWPAREAPDGMRWLLVRVVPGLTQEQAIKLAAASQLSTSATEGRIGRALGIVRSLGLDADKIPMPYWTHALASDDLEAFLAGGYRNESDEVANTRRSHNQAFKRAILSQMDRAKATRYEGDDEQMVDLLTSVLLGLLPAEIRRGNLIDNPKVEDALIGAMPAILTTHGLAKRRDIRPEYDLYAVLPEAVNVFAELSRRKIPFARLKEAIDAERGSLSVPGVKRLSDASDLTLALAGAFYNASRRAAPSVVISDILTRYVEDAVKGGSPAQTGFLGGLGFGGPPPDEAAIAAEKLAALVPGFVLPSIRQSATGGGMFAARTNPRRR